MKPRGDADPPAVRPGVGTLRERTAPTGEESVFAELDTRPVTVALAGPNGVGKTTFHDAHLQAAGLRFLNADRLARELGVDAYAAARMLAALRQELTAKRESFIFETVFSDPVGDKLAFLKQAARSGYTVVLVYIGLANARVSEERVAMRVSQGGHDVPTEKLVARLPRTRSNLKAAIRELPHVIVFDNNDLRMPFRKVAVFKEGRAAFLSPRMPDWIRPLL